MLKKSPEAKIKVSLYTSVFQRVVTSKLVNYDVATLRLCSWRIFKAVKMVMIKY